MGIIKNMQGFKVGRLTVIKISDIKKANRHTYWECKCSCGTKIAASGALLRDGRIKSCGCLKTDLLKKRNYKHGDGKKKDKIKLYNTWIGIKQRCNNPNNQDYRHYGDRGIKLCDDWGNYINFKQWALLNDYSDELEIDRIDNDGDYKPSNCRWVKHIINVQNSSMAKLTEKIVAEIKSVRNKNIKLKAMAEKYNVSMSTISGIKNNKKWRNINALSLKTL